MRQAKTGDSVAIHYKGTLDDGTVFDSSEGREPLQFTIGNSEVIPGFEAAVIGLEAGQSKTTRIEPEQAYGPRSEERMITVGRDKFPDGAPIEIGQQFEVGGPGGQTVEVVEVSDASVTLDGNHPLAGEALTFAIELVGIG